jgi:exodeoxyribonuclease V alpha subunit
MSTPSTSTQQVNATPHYETITGVIERLTFHSEESGYTVARLTRSRSTDLTTIVGSFANIQPGQTLQLTGFWREHPQYGPQFQVTNYKETKPATLTGIEKYLGSGLIKGVGPVTAKRIVAYFGLETLDISDNLEQKCDRSDHILPTNEWQVRPLTKLDPEIQPEAWEQCYKRLNKSVTTKSRNDRLKV